MALSRPKLGFESRWGRQPSLSCKPSELRLGRPSLRDSHVKIVGPTWDVLPHCIARIVMRRLSRRSRASGTLMAKADVRHGLDHGNICVASNRSRDGNCIGCCNPPRFSSQLDGPQFARRRNVERPSKRFVYILRSASRPFRHYVGITSNLSQRLEAHNSGASRQTCEDRPWQFVVTIEFATEGAAVRFEKYLKSGSGRAFAKKHFSEPFDVTTWVKGLQST